MDTTIKVQPYYWKEAFFCQTRIHTGDNSYQSVWQNGNHSGEKLYGMSQRKMDYLYHGTHADITQAIYFFFHSDVIIEWQLITYYSHSRKI